MKHNNILLKIQLVISYKKKNTSKTMIVYSISVSSERSGDSPWLFRGIRMHA